MDKIKVDFAIRSICIDGIDHLTYDDSSKGNIKNKYLDGQGYGLLSHHKVALLLPFYVP